MINLPFVTWDGEAHTRDAEEFVDEMTRHYLVAALWSTYDDAIEGYLDDTYSPDEVSAESGENARLECLVFLKFARHNIKGWTPEQLGHNFWLTRNGHGTGFWDRDFGTEDSRQALTKLSHIFGEVDAYVGDDGQVWID